MGVSLDGLVNRSEGLCSLKDSLSDFLTPGLEGGVLNTSSTGGSGRPRCSASTSEIAVLNTFAIPCDDFAEHSMYRFAPMRVAMALACSGVMCVGLGPLGLLGLTLGVGGAFLKSDLSPTRMKGTSGQKCAISGTHLSITLSNDGGESIAKQTSNKLTSGYDKTRSRSYSSWPAVSQRASSINLPLADRT